MENDFKNKIKNIVWAIRKIVSLTYHDSRKMVKKFGITGPQILVIKTIHNRVPLSSAEISKILNVTPSNLTGIIDRLEERKIVTRIRKENDRRTVLIELTEKGKDLANTLPDPLEQKLTNGLYSLNPKEIDQVYLVLNQIIEIIGKEIDKEVSQQVDLIE